MKMMAVLLLLLVHLALSDVMVELLLRERNAGHDAGRRSLEQRVTERQRGGLCASQRSHP